MGYKFFMARYRHISNIVIATPRQINIDAGQYEIALENLHVAKAVAWLNVSTMPTCRQQLHYPVTPRPDNVTSNGGLDITINDEADKMMGPIPYQTIK